MSWARFWVGWQLWRLGRQMRQRSREANPSWWRRHTQDWDSESDWEDNIW